MLALLRSDLDEAWLVSAGLAHAPVLQLGQVAGKAVSHGFPLLFLGLRASWSLCFHNVGGKAGGRETTYLC